MPKPLTVWLTKKLENSWRNGNIRPLYLSPKKIRMQVKKQELECYMEQLTNSNWERSMTRLYIATMLIKLICSVHYSKCQAGWIRSWNQDCWKKYQQLWIYRWYHSNGRKWKEIKSFLMKMKEESEKARLKCNIQKTKIKVPGPIIWWQIKGGNVEAVTDFFSWAPKSLQMVTAAMKLEDVCSSGGKLWPT